MSYPPLEGLWSVDDDSFRGQKKIENKDKFIWTIMIRQPEFVTQEVFEVAKEVLHKKKPNLNLDLARLVDWEEGLCAQIMHIGPYDDELDTIQILNAFIKDSGYQADISVLRKHHEIYLSDPRKTDPKKLKTVIRHPIKPI